MVPRHCFQCISWQMRSRVQFSRDYGSLPYQNTTFTLGITYEDIKQNKNGPLKSRGSPISANRKKKELVFLHYWKKILSPKKKKEKK